MTGLTIHRAERADALVVALGELLRVPTGDPFTPEVVAVPSRGVERWLAQQLSHVLGAGDGGDGVCANVDFPSALGVLDAAAAAAHPAYAAAVEAWDEQRAVWPLLTLLGSGVTDEPWAGALAAHLEADAGRRFTVASTLARHFARYARARPAMLRAWHDGRDEQGDGVPLPDDLRWQAELWRRLRAELGVGPAELLDDACAALRADPGAAALPDRVSLFGPTRLAPSRIAVLDALAAGREVHLWLHHPSPALWDAVTPTSGRRADDPVAARVRHPLLASLSRDVREMQQLLPTATAATVHHPLPPRPATLLGRLQDELAADRPPASRAPVAPDDGSLTVHACHGPARQVEVVRETVLALLRDDPTLEPRDVLIMCPDVETFAPLVAAAFGMADEDGGHPAARLRVRLADRALRQTNPMLGLLAGLLDLGGTRATATELLDLATTAPVRRRFGFSDDDLERLRDWTTAANARWGLDAEHRAPYGLGAVDQGTWRAALDRLLLGVAMEEDGRWIGDVLPLDDVDSGDIDLAGRVAEFVDRVDHAVRACERPRPVGQWAALLTELTLSLGEPLQAWQGAQLRAELDDAAAAAADADVAITRSEVASLLRGRLAGRPTRASFRTGTLTVCTLVPMRSVPHRVVCLLGMDDGAFPRHGLADGDDVLARDPRVGERDVRSEDRQLFLDAVCAAQERLVVAYTGADPRSGAEVPPCVPLGELLDAVDATACTPDGRPGRDAVVVRHPLQPFDPRNFVADRPFSFDPVSLAGARAAVGARHDRPPLVPAPLPALPGGDVELLDLVRFVQHPARAFLRQRLGISTWEDDDDPSDALPIGLDGLEQWRLGERLLALRLAGTPVEACLAIERRRGDYPPGALGDRVVRDLGREVEGLLAACGEACATEPVSTDVQVELGGRVLGGTVTGVRGQTVLDVVYSRLGAKQRLTAWVKHLALVASTGDAAWRSVTVGRGSTGVRRAVIQRVTPELAHDVLGELLALRDDGLRAPLPMAVKTSGEYAQRRHAGADVGDATDVARRYWQGGQYGGENDDVEHRTVFDGLRPWAEFVAEPGHGFPDETTRFGVLARRLWTPLLQHESEGPA